MTGNRNEKFAQLIKELSAEFFGRESNKTSLITVTRATVSPDGRRATVFFTVLPESKQDEAVRFMQRQVRHLQDFLRKKMPDRNIPFLQIRPDLGELNRQNIDRLLRQI